MSLFCSNCAPSCPSGFQAPYCEVSTLPTSLTSPSPLGSAPLYAPCSFHAASLLRALPLATSSCSVHCPRSSRNWLLRVIQFQLKVTSSETSLITHVKHITLGVIKQTILSYLTRPSLPSYLKLPMHLLAYCLTPPAHPQKGFVCFAHHCIPAQVPDTQVL